MTRIITIVDAFDAITSHRAYDYARPVQSAFEILRSASGRQFDEELVREFIRWLGAFPVGTLVELHTGEVAVVVEKHEQLQLRRGSWCCAMRQSSAARRVIWTWRGSPWTRRARLIASAVGCPMAPSVCISPIRSCSRFCIRRPGRLRTGRLSLASDRLRRRFQAQSVTGRSVIVLYLNPGAG